MGNDHDSAQLQASTIPQNFEWRKSVKRLQRYGFRKFGSRPPEPWRPYPSNPKGWGVKTESNNSLGWLWLLISFKNILYLKVIPVAQWLYLPFLGLLRQGTDNTSMMNYIEYYHLWCYCWSVPICTYNILKIDTKNMSTSNVLRCAPENRDKLLFEPRPEKPYGSIGQYWFGSLQWRHEERDGVSNHQPRDCLLNRLFRRRSKKTSKLRVSGLCAGNSPVTTQHVDPHCNVRELVRD